MPCKLKHSQSKDDNEGTEQKEILYHSLAEYDVEQGLIEGVLRMISY